MPKKGGYDLLRKFDRFADPVYLTLNQQKKVKTPCGGGLSIFVAGLVIYWLVGVILTTIAADFTSTS